MEAFSFNTAVARLMELLNALSKYDAMDGQKNITVFKNCFKTLILFKREKQKKQFFRLIQIIVINAIYIHNMLLYFITVNRKRIV